MTPNTSTSTRPLRITPDEKRVAIQVYEKTHNCAAAARAIGRSKDGVWSMLKREGYTPSQSAHARLQSEDVATICNLYQQGATAKEILPLFNGKIACENTIVKIARDHGVPIRPRGARNVIEHEDFFDVIDTEQKAYILGLLLADGCLYYSNRGRAPVWSITLKSQDQYLLQQIRELVGSDNKIVQSRGCGCLSVTSERMANALIKYGVTPRKSKTATLPINDIPTPLHPHLIRGVFDGDGCITGKSCFFCGTELMMQRIKETLRSEIGVNNNKVTLNKNSGVHYFYFTAAKDVLAFYNYVYPNASLFLRRKRERFEQLPFVQKL